MELSMREKELLVMFGSERRLDMYKRLQNAIPYMTDSLYKASATALWNKLYVTDISTFPVRVIEHDTGGK